MKLKMHFCPIIIEEKQQGPHVYISRRLDKDKISEVFGEIKSVSHKSLGSRREGLFESLTYYREAFDEELKMEKITVIGEFGRKERRMLRLWAKEYKNSGNLNQYIDAYKGYNDMTEASGKVIPKEEKRKTYNFETSVKGGIKEKIVNVDNLSGLLNTIEAQKKEALNKAVIIEYISNENENQEKVVDEKIYNNCSVIGFSEQFLKSIDIDEGNRLQKEKVEVTITLLNKSVYTNM